MERREEMSRALSAPPLVSFPRGERKTIDLRFHNADEVGRILRFDIDDTYVQIKN